MANPTIDIGSKFDAKGFKQAETAVGKLTKNVKNLASGFGIAFGATAIVNFGKASLKAFADDEAAALRLSRAVTNLGLGFANPAVANYIANLEKTAKISDDILRPAFQGLLTTTGSLTKSQELLNAAITISRASGIDLATVSEDLAKGYVGITKGLIKYNTGLTKSELSTKSFSDILQILTKQSLGAASDYLTTTAYKMDALTIATNNAKEAIGLGLVTALTEAGGPNGFDGGTKKIDTFSNAIRDLIVDLGRLFKFAAAVPSLFELATDPVAAIKNYNRVYKELMDLKKQDVLASNGSFGGASGFGKNEQFKIAQAIAAAKLASDKKAAAAKLASDKKLAANAAAAAKKKALDEKNQAALSAASAAFDIKRISIAAALKETYDSQTKLRLLAMQAIEDDNGQAALDYLKQLQILQSSVQADKLKGLNGISETQLHLINTELLADLQSIDTSKMAQADKDAAKMAAWAKYNDAISKQGELMALSYYSERTQIELTSIAKLAALSEFESAQTALRKIATSADLAAIDEVSLAQALADESRNNNMIAYIALIDEAKFAAFDLAAATAAAASEQAYAITALAEANAAAQAIADAANAASVIAAAAAAAAAAAIIAPIPPVVPGADIPGTGGATIPGIDVPDYGGTLGGINLNPNRANDAYSAPVININSGPLLGSEETIAAAVQLALQTLNRQGANTSFAGAI